ncbi:hypothetical protein FB45DRAFT_1110888 [Roridomyces roridus]|uniref:Protein kinase domain-containing protein n=1 Tax=Roridomyces roridus TaxID=1738132 RepID=A0AAD7FDH7_9AGAR|nr:hypothetical protein FB45DRAFT_1110888 [Roridomyces roridus]
MVAPDNTEHLDWREPARKRMREDEEDGLEIIRHRDLNLIHEMCSGPGYLFHAGQYKDRAVIVKVFNAGARAREHLEATVALSKGLLHPNVLRIRGSSSPTSSSQFITYEDAYWKTAEGPLAGALRDGLDRSVVLGFKLVAGLSSGINYLNVQDTSIVLRAEDFDVFLDVNDRFLLSINPPSNAMVPTHRDNSGWALLNALCQKVFRSANRVLHDDDIERTPVVFNPSSLPTWVTGSPPLEQTSATVEEQADKGVSSVAPRREYVWRTMETQQSLATVAAQIHRDLDVRRTPIHKLTWTNAQSAHRCPGYVREEITLTTRTADSAVVSHDSPDPQEVCPVCHEVVIVAAVDFFRCVCGDSDPGWLITSKCSMCGALSHNVCLAGASLSLDLCHLCVKKLPSPPPLFIEPNADVSDPSQYGNYDEPQDMEVDDPEPLYELAAEPVPDSPSRSLVETEDYDWAWRAPEPRHSPWIVPRSFSYPPPGHPITNLSPYVPYTTCIGGSYLIQSPHWSPENAAIASLDPTPEVRYAVLPSFSPPSLPHASL